MELLRRLLPRLPAEAAPLVFTRNLVRCVITHLSDKKHMLHAEARDLVRHCELETRVLLDADKRRVAVPWAGDCG
jgi:hypothetical protein